MHSSQMMFNVEYNPVARTAVLTVKEGEEEDVKEKVVMRVLVDQSVIFYDPFGEEVLTLAPNENFDGVKIAEALDPSWGILGFAKAAGIAFQQTMAHIVEMIKADIEKGKFDVQENHPTLQ